MNSSDITSELNPLGINEKLNEWIQSQKVNPILINSPVKSKEKLESTKINLLEMQSEICERFLTILNNLPESLLNKFPDYDQEVFLRLKTLNQNVKARIRQTNRKLLTFDQENHPRKIELTNDEVIIIDDDSSPTSANSLPNSKASCVGERKKSQFQLKRPIASTVTQLHTRIPETNSSSGSLADDKLEKVEPAPSLVDKNDSDDSDSIVRIDRSKISAWSVMLSDSEDDASFNKKSPDKVVDGASKWSSEKSSDEAIDCGKYLEVSLKEESQQPDLWDDNKSGTLDFIGNVKNDGGGLVLNRLDFAHSAAMLYAFKTKFGLHKFRPNQLAAINAAVLGHDCFILMPTGGGKSLCYQLPALLSRGVTVVISPLRSLIVDQKQKLDSLDIPAMYMTGDLSQAEVNKVYRKLYEINTDLKLLYVTPEKVSLSPKFLNILGVLYSRSNLARFVIDEVHCVSQWGHDFRPDYNKMSMLKERFPKVPLMALTATATERVRSDILHQLHLDDSSCKWFISSFNRPNLRYSVIPKKVKSSNQQVVDLIKNKFNNQCGIVYCISRRDCDTCAQRLSESGIVAQSYHAGLDDRVRIERQTQWISERVKVICATIAFGMGIDKPNVRFVIHAAMPKSIEGYYQESGRAGRDGEAADCVLLYNYGDVYRYRNIIEKAEYANAEALKTHLDNLCKIVHYCDNLYDCRRALQLNYFGEKFDRQLCIAQADTTCDNCKTFDRFIDVDVTKDAKALVELVCSLNKVRANNVTILQVVDIYKGSDVSSIRYKLGTGYMRWFGQGNSMTKHEIERLIHKLIVDGFLAENLQLNNGIVCAYLVPGLHSLEIIRENTVQKKKTPENSKAQAKASAGPQLSAVAAAELKDLEQRCYEELMDMISGIAGALDVMVALRVMSQKLPSTEAEMLKVPHVTRANFDKYGKALLDITKKFAEDKKKILREEDAQMQYAQMMMDDDHDWMDIEDNIQPAKKSKKRPKSSTPTSKKSKKFKSNLTATPITNWVQKDTNGISLNPTKKKKKVSPAKKAQSSKNQSKLSCNYNGPGLCELTIKKK